jgi:nitrite reductase/ring-hydroxylating ferredoxin subunit
VLGAAKTFLSTEREGLVQPDVVVPLASVPEGRGLVVRVHERLRLAIFRVGDAVYAIDDVCPHQSASLGEGRLAGTIVACPRHGFLVNVTSGRCPSNPLLRVRTFPVEREGETVRVILPPAPTR